ncbi:MAG: tetratricopeptide repeat protein [Planctomycetota bacterium]
MKKIYLILLLLMPLSCVMPPESTTPNETNVNREQPSLDNKNTEGLTPKSINDIISTAQGWLNLAKTQYDKREIPACIASTAAAIQLIPNYAEAYLFMASVLAESYENKTFAKTAALRAYNLSDMQNNSKVSFEALRFLVRLDSANIDYQLKLAKIYRLSESDKQMAIEIYQKILQSSPRNTDALLGIAQSYSNLNDYEKCLSYIEKYFKAGGSNSQGCLLRAYVSSKTGNLEQTVKDLEKIVQDEKILEGPEGGQIYVLWSEVLTALEKYDLALNTPIFFGMTFFPQQKDMFDIHRAIIYEKKKEFEAADNIYNRLVNKGFGDMISVFYLMRGMNFISQKVFDKAKGPIDKFIQIIPKENLPKAWMMFWKDASAKQGKSIETSMIPSMKEQIAKDPEYILAYLCLGSYYYFTNNPEAGQNLQKVVLLAGNDPSLDNYGLIAGEMLKK